MSTPTFPTPVDIDLKKLTPKVITQTLQTALIGSSARPADIVWNPTVEGGAFELLALDPRDPFTEQRMVVHANGSIVQRWISSKLSAGEYHNVFNDSLTRSAIDQNPKRSSPQGDLVLNPLYPLANAGTLDVLRRIHALRASMPGVDKKEAARTRLAREVLRAAHILGADHTGDIADAIVEQVRAKPATGSCDALGTREMVRTALLALGLTPHKSDFENCRELAKHINRINACASQDEALRTLCLLGKVVSKDDTRPICKQLEAAFQEMMRDITVAH